MLKIIGHLTLERDFFQNCFRQCELLGITRPTVYYEAKQSVDLGKGTIIEAANNIPQISLYFRGVTRKGSLLLKINFVDYCKVEVEIKIGL